MNTVYTVKSGRYLQGALSGFPTEDTHIVVRDRHTLTIDASFECSGITVEGSGRVVFDPKLNIVVRTKKNIVLKGTSYWQMRPYSYVKHRITFYGFKETDFVGGGCCVLDSDVGMWVMENASLDLQGDTAPAWVHGTQVTPYTWRAGTRITVSPTKPGDYTFKEQVVGKDADFSDKSAEYIRLDYNVIIGGESDTCRSHLLVMSKAPQVRIGVHFQYMGPRNANNRPVLGRYGVHDHHRMDASYGETIAHCLVSDCGNQSYTIHASHGVTLFDCACYKVNETGYRWDPRPSLTDASNDSNDIRYEHCIAARLIPIPATRGFDLNGFDLGSGLRNSVMDCVAVGGLGRGSAAGFLKPEDANHTPNVWFMSNLKTHNWYSVGFRNWKNDADMHTFENCIAYNCGKCGLESGAYGNGYHYVNFLLFNNTVDVLLHALPAPNAPDNEFGYKMSFQRLQCKTIQVVAHTLPSEGHAILFYNCTFDEFIVSELPARVPVPPPGLFDIVDCKPFLLTVVGWQPGTVIREQNTQLATARKHDGTEWTGIDLFFKS